MFNKKKRRMLVNPQAPEFGLYHKGPIYGQARAENFVYNRQTLPLPVLLRGPGQIAGQFGVYQPAQLRALLSVLPQAIQGPAVVSGSLNTQPLVDLTGDDTTNP
jgi:hypothetical protein